MIRIICILDFDPSKDTISFSGYGSAIITIATTELAGGASGTLAPHTVDWYNDEVNTYVVANTSGVNETASNANMLIVLTGVHTLTGGDFTHS